MLERPLTNGKKEKPRTGVEPAGHGQVPGSDHFNHRPGKLNIKWLCYCHVPEKTEMEWQKEKLRERKKGRAWNIDQLKVNGNYNL